MPSCPRDTARLHFPWDVPTHLQINPAYDLIRTHGDCMGTGERRRVAVAARAANESATASTGTIRGMAVA